jgi:hypothetical protein
MHFRDGLGRWQYDLTKIVDETDGIVRVVGMVLHLLTLASPPQWAYIGFGTLARPRYWLTDLYVVGVLLLSIGIYLAPSVCLAWFSTYFSASTVIVLLHIVLLRRVFGTAPSPERSLLLFMCNVAQIVIMFGAWYTLGNEPEPLLTSVLTFATIGYAKTMPHVAMAQIATNFVLLAIYLAHLVDQIGSIKSTRARHNTA